MSAAGTDVESPGDDAPAADPGRHEEVDALLDLAVAALGGSRRDGQHRMAAEVADALASGEHLLVQAGTGTGKSLGYLVPAVHHAVTTDERVVVSTATLALQRQVLTRDLPLVADALTARLPRRPEIALLKGWHNYVCVHKLAGGYPEDEPGTLFDAPEEHPAPATVPAGAATTSTTGTGRRGKGTRQADRVAERLGEQVVRLREWAETTDTGDRDDLVPGVTDRAWRQASVTSLECLGTRCPMREDCFADAAKARAHSADVVVTNHAMLGIAASGSPGVLPEHQVVMVDEAHELADRVTSAATRELSAGVVEQAGRLARRHGGVATGELDSAAAALTGALISLPEGRLRDGLPPQVAAAVAAVRDATRSLLTALRPEGAAAPDPTRAAGLQLATSAVLAVFETAELMATPQDGVVLWCSRPDDGASRLHVAPLGVAGLIRDRLLAGRSAVLTSATLALGGSFDTVARQVGLGAEDDATPWHGLDVGTPFDPRSQGILYVARDLPAPGRDPVTEAQLDAIAELVSAAGGRTLGLFSSRRAAQVAAEALRERLDLPVLVQGEDQLPTLVARFAADEATSLFGTLSLWQGVDVPGRTCSLVLIDRIPFPRPDDPVRSARAEAVDAGGGNGFLAVSAAHAALLLAQGAGRLLRSTEDRGVVAVLDPRLATARYAGFLRRSLPDLWPTTDRAAVLAALRRLAGEETGAAGDPSVS